MALDIIVTNAGRAALVNAENTGTDPVTITQIGLTQIAFAPGAGALVLPDEFKRIAGVGGLVVADDTIHVTALDESDDAYSLRGFALYLADGTLFALYSQADPILVKTAESIGGLIADVVFADIDAALLTFGNTEFTNPPATEAALGVVEFADLAEAAAGLVGNRALSPLRAKAVVMAWLLTQDGAGSGLDADMLDGQHGAWYTDIAARLGYTPLNAATFTAAEILARLLTVDGSGSGLDADRLNGQLGTYYTNIIARLGYTPLDVAQFTAAQILTRLLTVDGSGSAIDADLLDGQHGAYYADVIARLGYTPLNAANFSTGTAASGRWRRQPDGAGGSVLIQRGFAGPFSAQGSLTINLPTAHSDLDYDVQLTAVIAGAGDYDNHMQEIRSARTVNSITVYCQDPSSGGLGSLAGVNWKTDGY
jgi:hypothetical protein